MSGLTSGISAKLSGQEGIFGGGKLKKAIKSRKIKFKWHKNKGNRI